MTRKRWVGVLLALSLLAGVGWVIRAAMLPAPPFRFIPNIKPTWSRSEGTMPLQVYHFKADFGDVCRKAKAEVLAKGGQESGPSSGFQYSLLSNEMTIDIFHGYYGYRFEGGSSSLHGTGSPGLPKDMVTVTLIGIGPTETFWDRIRGQFGL